MQEKFFGVVKWFSATKGYGFIGKSVNTQNWFENSENDIFVHYSAILESGYKKLEVGDEVEFAVANGHAGKWQAELVSKLKTDDEKTEVVA